MTRAILLTGASGMIGSRVALALCERGHRVIGADIAGPKLEHENYTHVTCDLTRPDDVEALFRAHPADRAVHLAALAHVTGEADLSWNRYFLLNVLVSQHVFECAARRSVPVFFASTVDVYGIPDSPVTEQTPPAPLGGYARSKWEAENRLAALMGDTPYFIARFAPVYTSDDMRDVRRRYYLKYPSVAYLVGGGRDYAFLSVDRVADAVCLWAQRDQAPRGVVNFCEDAPFNAADLVAEERRFGKADRVLRVSEWMARLGLLAAKLCPDRLRLNVNKILNPARFDTGVMARWLGGGDGAPFRGRCPDLRGVRVLLLEGFARQNMALMPALKKLGCHVTTLNASRLDVGYASRWPDARLLESWDRDDAEASARVMLRVLKAGHYDVVIPTTDFSARLLADNHEAVSRLTHPAENGPELFYRAMDKRQTMAICEAADVPHPRTAPDAGSVEAVLAAGLGWPVVIKPRIGYGGIGFHVLRDAQALRERFGDTAARWGDLLAQQYIPQTGRQLQCQLFMDESGEAKSAVLFDKTRWYPVTGGSSCCNTTLHDARIVGDCVRLLKAMGWKGYADVDLIEDPRDGVAKVMEVNPRVTGGVKLCFAAGTDPARQIVELALGLPVTEYPDYRDGVRLRYMHTDLLWLLKSPNRFRAKPGWFDFRHTTDQIFSLRDPWPWFTYTAQGLRRCRGEMAKRNQ